MLKRILILFFPCLLVSGCGVQGPLYLPPDPNDSYLSQIRASLNAMTGQETAAEAPAEKTEIEVTVPDLPEANDQKDKDASTAESNSTEKEK